MDYEWTGAIGAARVFVGGALYQGTANSPSEAPYIINGAPTAATLAGSADAGALAVDRLGSGLYQNKGTKAAPNWSPMSASFSPAPAITHLTNSTGGTVADSLAVQTLVSSVQDTPAARPTATPSRPLPTSHPPRTQSRPWP